MYIDINLAGKGSDLPKKERVEKIRLISFASLFIIAVLSVLVFLVNLRLSTTSVKKQETQVSQNLTNYNQTIAKISLLNTRLSDISSILARRTDYSQNVEKIINFLSSNSTVVSYQEQGKVLTISISSKSLLDLNDFLNKTLALSSVSDVKLTQLSSASGAFSMTLEVDLL